jgi:amino acid adenylation domain-containing protein
MSSEINRDEGMIVASAKVSGLLDEVETLTPEQRAVMLLWLKTELSNQGEPASQTIHRAVRGETAPLSFAQQRLWFIDQLEPGSEVYNIPIAVHLEGQLNIRALEQTFTEIVRRHEILRTTFTIKDGQPSQLISPAYGISLPVLDLGGFSPHEREAKAEQFIQEEVRRPFDLTIGPLLRAGLIRLDDHEHIALLTMHHIISDGWSLRVFVKEVSVLYEAFDGGRVSPLAELPVQYADYAVWQREWLRGEVLAEQLSYWRQQLTDAPVLELPTDRIRPARQTFSGATCSLMLSGALGERLGALSRGEDATLFMTLLAAFNLLLSRYARQTDVVVGTPIAGRNHPECEDLIGFFVNTLALRTDLSGDPSFRELLRRVKAVTLGAYAHQDIPFARLAEELQTQRNLSRPPFFQVVFTSQNAEHEQLELPGLKLGSRALSNEVAKFDLTLGVAELADGLLASVEYNTDLFDETTINRLLRHFEILLESIVEAPGRPLSSLHMLSPSERQQVLFDWNDTARLFAPDQSLLQMFQTQVEERPDAFAVRSSTGQLTYAELNRRANQLAHHLLTLGVGLETPVALFMERSVEMIVAALGVLKAGGAYLPLDPAYPAERLAFTFTDSAVPLLLTVERLLDSLPPVLPQVFCLDRDWQLIDRQRADNPPSAVTPDNLAYIIYTSGSTGQPKGVQITHRGLLNLVHWHQQFYEVRPADRSTQVAGVAFDAVVWEVWPYLTAGACLFIPDEETRSTPRQLLAWLVEQSITISFLPTPLAESLLLLAWPPETSLRALLTGGDQLHQPAPEGVPFQLVNNYGPTENTVVTTAGLVARAESGARVPPIGHPIANAQVYLLDEQLEPVPIGVKGELYIGGTSLARGYLQRTELTAERFIPHPYSEAGGERLYRTGDVGRYLASGEIEYLGRSDQQVKVRGYRIELGEIEAALVSEPQVREAVVVVRAEQGEPQLVGYVVAEAGETLSVSELRSALERRLPQYMVPARIVVLGEMPLTANGKVDRRALPAPQRSRAADGAEPLASYRPTEEIMAGLWATVLGLDEVQAQENFFELGGHSLLATQLMSRVRESFGVELPVRNLFEQPTVSGLAGVIEQALTSERRLLSPPIVPVAREGALPVSFAQHRFWFLSQLEPESPVNNTPLAVRLTGRLNLRALERTFNELVRRHEILRTTFDAIDGQPVQVIAPALSVALPLRDLSALPETEREVEARSMMQTEACRPFDLMTGPLLRVALLRLGAQEHIALLTLHHIIMDGWSMGLLIREMATLYQAFDANLESPLPELSIQYADFAVWQQAWLRGEVLERELAYWKAQLAGVPLLALPTDKPRPPFQTFAGTTEAFTLSPELSQGLRALSRQHGATVFMILLAAFQILLQRYTGQDDIVVGTSIANRNRFETEQLLGCFFNHLALRTDLSGNPTFRELLRRVRDITFEAYAHQDPPFEKVLEALQTKRSTSHAPLFQVALVFQNTPSGVLEVPGLSFSSLPSANPFAKFDLNLVIEQQPDGFHGTWEYKTDLFHASTIRRMINHFRILLTRIVENPELEIERIEMSTAQEREQLSGAFADDLGGY